jgi:hypothetical protein
MGQSRRHGEREVDGPKEDLGGGFVDRGCRATNRGLFWVLVGRCGKGIWTWVMGVVSARSCNL